jgi:uncharacterized protein YgiM (DUF1202 family)
MKKGLLITSVLAWLFFCAAPVHAQSTSSHMPESAGGDVAKCTGKSDCPACKNCSACAHCKEEGGKCGVCKKNDVHHQSSKHDEDYTKVEWSAKSLKPATAKLQSLEVHSGPGESFKVVGKVSKSDPLIIIGEREGWYKIVVSHADLVGFVEVSHVSIVQ